MTIHDSLAGPEASHAFVHAIHEAVALREGDFVAWIKPGGLEDVVVHLERPARKETLGGVVEPWKRSIRLRSGATEGEVRAALERLLGS